LKFDKDKRRWIHWLFEAKKRFGLMILNFTVTSNHIHLLVYDGKVNIIPKSIQLIAGRTGREYNQRKNRKGAFWEDRYHATAVKTGNHLIRCLAYIDLNMVRAGVVRHPCEWMYGGYNEIQNSKQRYSLINRQKLTALLGIKNNDQLTEYHRKWVEEVLKNGTNQRDEKWTQSIAVGDKEFVMETKAKLGAMAIGRRGVKNVEGYELKERQSPYNRVFAPEKWSLRLQNDHFWNISS
jgi:REP element-mobilizing transposase RayT